MSKNKKYSRVFESNRYSKITSKRTGSRVVTQTSYRDPGTLEVEVSSKDLGSGATRLFMRTGEGEFLALDGNEARTVYRTLQRHFDSTGRSIW